MQTYKLLLTTLLCTFSFASSAEYKLPDYEKTVLKNGLTVYLMEQHEVPLIDVNMVIKSGAIEDGNKAGLASITAENLTFGTKSLTKAEVNNALDFIGAEIHSGANLEFTQLGGSFAVNNTNQVLNILRDMLISPRFEQEAFDKYKRRHILALEQAKESPKSVINNYFSQLTFGASGYGSIVDGDANTVSGITLEDIKAFHQQWYQPSNAAIIVVGDFSAKQMKQEINKRFGSWQGTLNTTKVKTAKMPKFEQSSLLLVNKDDAVETTFLIGGQGVSRKNPDRVGISVINTILGARFTSWLNDELRVNAGLTYGARSRFVSYSNAGSFYISTFTKTETTVEAIDLALKTYSRLWQQGIDEATLNSAKAYVKGLFPPNFETSTQLAGLLTDMYGYDFDSSYIDTFEQQVNSLTLAKTKQLIAQYFPQENLQFVLIGKADKLRDDVAKYGQITEVNIKDTGFNIH